MFCVSWIHASQYITFMLLCNTHLHSITISNHNCKTYVRVCTCFHHSSVIERLFSNKIDGLNLRHKVMAKIKKKIVLLKFSNWVKHYYQDPVRYSRYLSEFCLGEDTHEECTLDKTAISNIPKCYGSVVLLYISKQHT